MHWLARVDQHKSDCGPAKHVLDVQASLKYPGETEYEYVDTV